MTLLGGIAEFHRIESPKRIKVVFSSLKHTQDQRTKSFKCDGCDKFCVDLRTRLRYQCSNEFTETRETSWMLRNQPSQTIFMVLVNCRNKHDCLIYEVQFELLQGSKLRPIQSHLRLNLFPHRAPVAQLVEHRVIMREVVSSTPIRPTLRVLK